MVVVECDGPMVVAENDDPVLMAAENDGPVLMAAKNDDLVFAAAAENIETKDGLQRDAVPRLVAVSASCQKLEQTPFFSFPSLEKN
jgi:hypothetical protein